MTIKLPFEHYFKTTPSTAKNRQAPIFPETSGARENKKGECLHYRYRLSLFTGTNPHLSLRNSVGHSCANSHDKESKGEGEREEKKGKGKKGGQAAEKKKPQRPS